MKWLLSLLYAGLIAAPMSVTGDDPAKTPSSTPPHFVGSVEFDFESSDGASYKGVYHLGPNEEQRLDIQIPVKVDGSPGRDTLVCCVTPTCGWAYFPRTSFVVTSSLPVDTSASGWAEQLSFQIGQTKWFTAILRYAAEPTERNQREIVQFMGDAAGGEILNVTESQDGERAPLKLTLGEYGTMTLDDWKPDAGYKSARTVTYMGSGRWGTAEFTHRWRITSVNKKRPEATFFEAPSMLARGAIGERRIIDGAEQIAVFPPKPTTAGDK